MFDSLFRRGRRATPAKRVARIPPPPREARIAPQTAPTLRDVAPGGRCRVVRVRARGAVRQRLMDLGLVPSTVVIVVRRNPLNDALEIQLGGQLVSLRHQEAGQVEIAFEA